MRKDIAVTLRASVWIETSKLQTKAWEKIGHTPRECVD